ncbi:hypothetical protein PoB_005058300 [Plakobranchus ocellatus]|uniref:Uncharacterized protein n=1 Tax=Plakobranchus ocellatus TaxID=259542 RepID=A0AAV4BXX3_9GAST|nr:hypothetical protein PoB_005058300 [Plakobranchus ocellatus]
MTADEFQQHIWILKQLVKQRQSLQKKAVSRKKDPACQKEKKIVGLLENSRKLFCVPMAFSNQAPSSHKTPMQAMFSPQLRLRRKDYKKFTKVVVSIEWRN